MCDIQSHIISPCDTAHFLRHHICTLHISEKWKKKKNFIVFKKKKKKREKKPLSRGVGVIDELGGGEEGKMYPICFIASWWPLSSFLSLLWSLWSHSLLPPFSSLSLLPSLSLSLLLSPTSTSILFSSCFQLSDTGGGAWEAVMDCICWGGQQMCPPQAFAWT